MLFVNFEFIKKIIYKNICLKVKNLSCLRKRGFYLWWTVQDLNLWPIGYEPTALPAELTVLVQCPKSSWGEKKRKEVEKKETTSFWFNQDKLLFIQTRFLLLLYSKVYVLTLGFCFSLYILYHFILESQVFF